jgi:hypothetical protein
MRAGGVVFLRGLPLLTGVIVLGPAAPRRCCSASPPLLFRVGCHPDPAAVLFGGGTGVAGRVRRSPRRPLRPPCVNRPERR